MIYGEEILRLQIHTLNGGDWLTPVDQPLSGLRPYAVIGMSYPPSHPVFLLIPASACRAPFYTADGPTGPSCRSYYTSVSPKNQTGLGCLGTIRYAPLMPTGTV